MKAFLGIIIFFAGVCSAPGEGDSFYLSNVTLQKAEFKGRKCYELICDIPMSAGRESYSCFAALAGCDFTDGVIEVDLASFPAANAHRTSRGFAGVVFRASTKGNPSFECFYVRPTNGRAKDQLRRNHSTQYMSYPDFLWYTTRRETPGLYEAYADMLPGEWMHLKIEVEGQVARFFVNNMDQPVLIVNDLKLGGRASGSVGLWSYPDTIMYFDNLVVRKAE
ncbi:DUF1080 domain-containing protein [Puniceicoccaceae bacterium K14]|nr:DUF1080 domain-containing protein [Puniceicoccaceae bacterium K14]